LLRFTIQIYDFATGKQLKCLYKTKGKEGFTMAVEAAGEKYRCNICGNEVTVTKAGGGVLVCCGEDMEKLE
jgi:desulfoferrodoxin-like iron-binding protein